MRALSSVVASALEAFCWRQSFGNAPPVPCMQSLPHALAECRATRRASSLVSPLEALSPEPVPTSSSAKTKKLEA